MSRTAELLGVFGTIQ
jgi:hypothetical protein